MKIPKNTFDPMLSSIGGKKQQFLKKIIYR